MKRIILLISVLLYYSIIGTAQPKVICATASESFDLVLKVPPGGVITAINFASFGTPAGTCGNFTIGDCHASNSKSVVEAYALNQNSVVIPASNQVFGDPCESTYKRLYVEAVWTCLNSATVYLDKDGDGYGNAAVSLVVSDCNLPAGYVLNNTDCDDNSTSVNPGAIEILGDGIDNNCNGITDEVLCTGTICATANEADSLVLTAPPGALITSITFASYGTPNGSCGNFSVGGCNSSTGKEVVEGYALNKNSAIIPVSNEFFGDPCSGIPKRLYVEAVWTAKDIQPVLISSPVHGSIFIAPATITLSANACNSIVQAIDFYNGNDLILTTAAPSFSGKWLKVPVGNYSITAKSKDKNGNIVATSNAVDISVIANKAPTVKITSPVDGSNYTANATIILSAEANDRDGIIKTVSFYNGNKLIFTEHAPPFYRKWFNVKEGNYVITAEATDDKGVSTTSSAVNISVLPSEFPSVNITKPTNDVIYPPGSDIFLSAEAVVRDGSISKVDFYNGTNLIFTEYKAPYSNKWRNVPLGNYYIIAKATDGNGNVIASRPVHISVGYFAACAFVDQPTFGFNFNGTNVVNNNNGFTDPGESASLTVCDGEQYFTSSHFHGSSSNLYDVSDVFVGGTLLFDGLITHNTVLTADQLSSTAGTYTITLFNPDEGGTLIQTVTPFNDLDHNGRLDAGDCAGESIVFTYNVTPKPKWYKDSDGDGHASETMRSCNNPGEGWTTDSLPVDDCNDNDPTPCAGESFPMALSKPGISSGRSNHVSKLLALNLSPNPVAGQLSISVDGLLENTKSALSVLSATGVIVKTINASTLGKNLKLNVSMLSSGVYFIKFVNGDKILYKQFLKM
jgi:hypothetical protein